jgi:hypothetical protein
MRLPRVRISVLRMMVAVAILAVACLGVREYWTKWSRRGGSNPVFPSELSASAGTKAVQVLVPGHPIPVSIMYDFRFGNPFGNPKPAPGTTCRLLASVWFEDVGTGLYVDGYSFDAPLTVGGRETASGTITWDAMIPHPGRYCLRYHLYREESWDGLVAGNGGGRSYHFVTAAALGQSSIDPGTKP